MIAVYCSKIAESGLPAWVPVLIGTAVGAVITGTISYLLQRQAHKNVLNIEQKKYKREFINKYVMKDIFLFLDSEINFLQKLSAFNYIPSSTVLDGTHREGLAKIQATMKVLNDPSIVSVFDDLINKRTEMENIIVSRNGASTYAVLNEAIKLAAEIKLKMSNAS